MPSKTPTAATPVRHVIRFTPEVYRDLVAKLPRPHVDERTSDLQAGFQLGVQHVLAVLRDGFTHEER
jgi:hypothetical protein